MQWGIYNELNSYQVYHLPELLIDGIAEEIRSSTTQLLTDDEVVPSCGKNLSVSWFAIIINSKHLQYNNYYLFFLFNSEFYFFQ